MGDRFCRRGRRSADFSEKSPRRRNMRHGCINRRPFLRSEMEELARATWPVRMIWLRIIAGMPRRGPLPPPLTRSDLPGSQAEYERRRFPRSGPISPPPTTTTVPAEEQRAIWSWPEFQNARSRRPAVGPAWGSEAIPIPQCRTRAKWARAKSRAFWYFYCSMREPGAATANSLIGLPAPTPREGSAKLHRPRVTLIGIHYGAGERARALTIFGSDILG